jgi:hypothetical protein
MAQNYTINCYNKNNIGAVDLQAMENNFECLRSSFSGTSTPLNPVNGQVWYDETDNNFKIYNDTESEWWGVMWGDADQLMVVYRDSAPDGWNVSSSATDKVIALKGGTTYTTGGATAGSWTISGLTTSSDGNHRHEIDNDLTGETGTLERIDTGDYTEYDGVHSHSVNSAGTWRISAAVCTLQYVDVGV